MAKEGLTLCLGLLIITFLIWGLWLFDGKSLTFAVGVAGAFLTMFVFYFFRDPQRTIPDADSVLVSPADGKIVAIKQLTSHQYLNSSATQISIFLSPLDVHINRIPKAATVEFVNYKKGSFWAAYKDQASEENEQTEIGLITDNGTKIVVKQIAGWMARRIVCRLEKGNRVSTGEKFGMIKFGSRTDLIVPADTELEVKLGQHVKGGSTIIGRLPIKIESKTIPSASKQSNA